MSPLIPFRRTTPLFDIFNTKALDRVWEDLTKGFDQNEVFAFQNKILDIGNPHVPPCDIVVKKDDKGKETGLELRYAVAGYDKSEIDVKVDLDVGNITIFGKKAEESSEGDDKDCVYIHKGIKKSQWQVSYRLGDKIDKNKISAQMKDGSLKISLPYLKKVEEEKPANVKEVKIQ